jgi:hypothetical protein
MKKYEVVLEFENKNTIVEANSIEEAKTIALKKYEKLITSKKSVNDFYWVADCYEIKRDM